MPPPAVHTGPSPAAAYSSRAVKREPARAPCAFWGVIMGQGQHCWRAKVGDTGGTETEVLPDAAPWTPPSWDEVVRTHSARVYRLAYRLTGNVPDAEDLTQEVFVRVFRSLPTYTPGTFEGWLHRITTNLFLDMARRKQRIRFDALGEDAAEGLPSREPPPQQGFNDAHFDADVQRALNTL